MIWPCVVPAVADEHALLVGDASRPTPGYFSRVAGGRQVGLACAGTSPAGGRPGRRRRTARARSRCPPSWPGYQASTIAATLSRHGVSTGPPVSSTTTVFGLAAATCSISASWSPWTVRALERQAARGRRPRSGSRRRTRSRRRRLRERRPRGRRRCRRRSAPSTPGAGALRDRLARRRDRERRDVRRAAAGLERRRRRRRSPRSTSASRASSGSAPPRLRSSVIAGSSMPLRGRARARRLSICASSSG